MELSTQQQRALDAIEEWWFEGADRKQVFRLFGYAGTGKTTIAKLLPEILGLRGRYEVDEWENETYRPAVVYCAYTGKAAAVLRSKGCNPAQTLHSLIYVPKQKNREELHDLCEKLAQETDPGKVAAMESRIEELEEELAQPSFARVPVGDVHAQLIVVDEVSMLDDQIGEDLLAHGIPVIAIGDPAQLPPVNTTSQTLIEGYFMRDPADVVLTEVRRQEADSPVLELATRIRDGRGLTASDYVTGTCAVVGVASPDATILVGKNATRWHFNTMVRAQLGRHRGRPQTSDRIVCLHNNSELGIFHGQLFDVVDVLPIRNRPMAVKLVVRDCAQSSDGPTMVIPATLDGFIDEQSEARGKREAAWRRDLGLFTWGYALTVHKSQGSQWPFVFVVDESHVFRRPGERERWLYTAVTRAASQVMLGGASQLV